jgi:hypothetical protein
VKQPSKIHSSRYEKFQQMSGLRWEIFAPKSWMRVHTLGCFWKSISRNPSFLPHCLPPYYTNNSSSALAPLQHLFMHNCRSESALAAGLDERSPVNGMDGRRKGAEWTRSRRSAFLALEKSRSSSSCKSYFCTLNFLQNSDLLPTWDPWLTNIFSKCWDIFFNFSSF